MPISNPTIQWFYYRKQNPNMYMSWPLKMFWAPSTEYSITGLGWACGVCRLCNGQRGMIFAQLNRPTLHNKSYRNMARSTHNRTDSEEDRYKIKPCLGSDAYTQGILAFSFFCLFYLCSIMECLVCLIPPHAKLSVTRN